MEISYRKTDEIIPYGRNPRNNREAVKGVQESIKRFGFKVPIVIDRNGVIVCGHTRHKAAQALKLKTVPCILADDLTEDEIKAFRLADNRVAEKSTWNMELLAEELGDIELDMTPFGFTAPEDRQFGEERERTDNAYNLGNFDRERSAGFYNMPIIRRCSFVPDDLVGFNYVLSTDVRRAGVHFFIDDYQFERIWNHPEAYTDRLEEFQCVLTPDFSLYRNMPVAMKVWNVYRSRLVGQICQDCGMKVIPTLSWAELETYTFCFDGLEPGGTVAVSTVGVMRSEESLRTWKDGMSEALARLTPKHVIVYGSMPEFDFQGAEPVHFPGRKFKRD